MLVRHRPVRKVRSGRVMAVFTSRVPPVSPMHPTLVREPYHRDAWAYEEKYDGWRMLAFKDADRVQLVSRNGHNHTERFAAIAHAVARLPARTLILDGEVWPSTRNSSPTSIS